VNLILYFTNIAIFFHDDSFGRDGLADHQARRAAGEGMVVSKVVPFPWDTSLKGRRRLPVRLSPGFGSFKAVDRQ
jgi:hypothetical protein